MRTTIHSMALIGLLAAGGLLLTASDARAQWGYGGNGVTIGRPGGFNVTIGNGYPNYGYGGAYGYNNYGYAPGMTTYGRGYSNYYAPGTTTYGRGYSNYYAPGYGTNYPNYGTTGYRLAPGVRYNTYSYPAQGYSNYGYSNYRYAPRSYYRTW